MRAAISLVQPNPTPMPNPPMPRRMDVMISGIAGGNMTKRDSLPGADLTIWAKGLNTKSTFDEIRFTECALIFYLVALVALVDENWKPLFGENALNPMSRKLSGIRSSRSNRTVNRVRLNGGRLSDFIGSILADHRPVHRNNLIIVMAAPAPAKSI